MGIRKNKLVPTNRFKQARQYNRKNQRKIAAKKFTRKNFFLDFYQFYTLVESRDLVA